jgi:hypothetical protein
MKLGVFTQTRNARFVSARQRIQPKIVMLKGLLAPIILMGRHNNVLLTFVDEGPDFVGVIRRGSNDDIYEVDVGYDCTQDYAPDDDVLVIQLLEEKLKHVIESDDGFAPHREELLQVITDWTTEAIGA